MKTFKIYITAWLIVVLALILLLFVFKGSIITDETPSFVLAEGNADNDDNDGFSLRGEITVSDNNAQNFGINVSLFSDNARENWQSDFDELSGILSMSCKLSEFTDEDDYNALVDSLSVSCSKDCVASCEYVMESGFCHLYITLVDEYMADEYNITCDTNVTVPLIKYSEINEPIVIFDVYRPFLSENEASYDELLNSVSECLWKDLTDADFFPIIVFSYDSVPSDVKLMEEFIERTGTDIYIGLTINPDKGESTSTVAYYNDKCFIPGFNGLVLADELERCVSLKIGTKADGIFVVEEGIVTRLGIPAADLKLGVTYSANGRRNIDEQIYSQYAAEGILEAITNGCNKKILYSY